MIKSAICAIKSTYSTIYWNLLRNHIWYKTRAIPLHPHRQDVKNCLPPVAGMNYDLAKVGKVRKMRTLSSNFPPILCPVI